MAWDLLDEKEEQELHKTRLVNIEEKPFKRITKRLVSITAIANSQLKQQPTPPPEDANGEKEAHVETKQEAASKTLREIDQIKDDLTLDFAAFDSSIARLQFLLDANVRERERYKADQQRILEECQTVRGNNARLREQLEGAKATLAQRKEYDKLANALMAKGLRPRGEQESNLKKLEEEIRDLEKESETYAVTWRERRDQFSKIMDEGMLLRRQIRDEKEEVERREGMNEDGEEDGEASRGGQTPRHVSSGNVTPHPDSGAVPRPTSALDGHSEEQADGLKPRPGGLGSFSRSGSAVPSQSGTPRPQHDEDEIEEGEDVEMDDQQDTQITSGGDTPHITVDAPDGMEVDN
ncbi:THO complex subunit 7 [Colletotrichum tofieldiae]|uniref:THO complex subunit 7 n=2 Tax=Colletotrichum spaethianum species complex TaxID=2707349 RepID=A0A166UYY0_9PEZI|nr:THO complex subunit 7 [Colletotrichum tofieldiae]GJC84027.1 THO complex subunit mft1 [Colletotrichum liriopes]GKT55207.1 THO complex subunit 7 [Colletotrichum tofieldiae]GKT75507.1 THO complex subunit 7 [Colletotrichum tofieldiae]